MPSLLDKEWLEADGRGGFASDTAAGIRTRRYHALLLVATRFLYHIKANHSAHSWRHTPHQS